jgi:lipopolysaccharide export system permease protein
MLKILDKYIIKKYLGSFFFTVLALSLISVVIDFSQNVEEFIDEKLPAQKVVREYYLNFIVFMNGLLWPLFALVSVIFFTSRLAYNSEIISMLNAGLSFNRLLRPYLVAAGILALTHLVFNHFVIPHSNKNMLDFKHSYIEKESDKGKNRDIHMFISPETKIYVRFYFKLDSVGSGFRMETFDKNQLVSLITAENLIWKGPPNKWQLADYLIYTFKGDSATMVDGYGEKLDTTLRFTPQDFVRYEATQQMIPTNKLQAFINEEKLRGLGNTKKYEIELHRRTSDPFAIIIVTIIGFAVAARKVRGGMGLQLAIGVSLGAIFVFLAKFSMTFATNEALPALIGVWLPNIVFATIAYLLIVNAQK